MKRTLTIFATAAMAAGMMLAQPAANQPHRRGMFGQKLARELNLNDAQKAQAKSIFANARQAAEPLRAQLKQDREALRAAVKTNDTARIDKLSGQEGQIIGKLMAARGEAMARFYQTLTPQQRLQADQLHQSWKNRRRNS